MDNQFLLLRERRFRPLFATQFLGAFNDNLFKTALSVMAAYGLWQVAGLKPEILVSLAAGLFILPFVLFAPLAGDMADKYDKSRMMQVIKGVEIVIAAGAVAGLYLHSLPLLMAVLFAFGTHSAFFSPCKLSILPQHLRKDELIGGNALLNTGAFLGILAGTILGGLLALAPGGAVAVSVVMVLSAVAGFAFSLFIPKAPAPSPRTALQFNVFREAKRILAFARAQGRGVFPAMIGSAWFYFTGAMTLSQLPNFTKQVLGVDTFVLTFFMCVFSLGIGLGGLLNNRLLHSRVESIYVPAAALAMSVFALDLFFVSGMYSVGHGLLGDYVIGLQAFLSSFAGWRVTGDLLALSVAGGIYIVPLKAIVQDRTDETRRARVIAGGAMLDALFILGSALAALVLLSCGLSVRHLFLLLALGSLAVALYLQGMRVRGISRLFRRAS